MVQKIKITSLILKDNQLVINLQLKFRSNENYSPKLQIIFSNDVETRRFPLNKLVYNKNSNNEYFISAIGDFKINYIFWNSFIGDIKIDFSLLLGDKFIENFSVEAGNDFNNNSDNYFAKLKTIFFQNNDSESKLLLKANYNELKKIENNIKKYSILLSLNRFFLIIITVLSFPFFLIDGFLASKGLVKKSSYYLKGNSTLKSILFHVNWRTNNSADYTYGIRPFKISLMKFFYFFTKRRKVKNNRITFLSERANVLSGNFEFIYDALKNKQKINKRYKKLEIVTFLKDKSIKDLNFLEMINFSNLIATSKVILLDDFYPTIHNFDLKNEVSLIQAWHAVGAFKTFGFSRFGKPGGTPQKSPNHRNYNYAIVSSDEIRRFYGEGFGISDDKVIATGIPRTDIFFNEEYKIHIRKELYKKFTIFKDKKIILFAPTFRGEGKEDAFYPLDKFNIEEFFECLNNPNDYVLIIKHHPFVKNKVKIPKKYKHNVIDLSNESNINDLLFIIDILITDYSSVIFEAALLDIPMLFYAYDLVEYTQDRGFYYDYKSLTSGKIVYSFKDLVESINKKDFEDYKLSKFKHKFFDDLDGKSTERVIDLIFKIMKDSKKD